MNPSIFFLVIALILIMGCGTGEQARARNAMEVSKAAYENCLKQNPQDPDKCESLKRIYEADMNAYQEASKSTSPVVTGFIEVGPGNGRH